MPSLNYLFIAAPLAFASAAFAQPSHLSDAQFIAASRCAGLMESSALGRQDSRDLEARLKAEGGSRTQDVFDRADEAREDASRAASHAGAYGKAALVAERDGACRVYSGGAVASVAPSGATRTN